MLRLYESSESKMWLIKIEMCHSVDKEAKVNFQANSKQRNQKYTMAIKQYIDHLVH